MFRRVLLATDFSPHAEAAYPWAARLAASNDGCVVLAHALEDDLVATAPVFAHYMTPGALDVGHYREEFRRGALKALDAAAIRLQALGVTVETLLLERGKPALALVEAARTQRCSAIVIATHGRGGLAHLLLGSTAEKVVRTAKVPVLTVHEGDVALDEER
jgi:nucleotide-binding universal stress UspA family protein